MLTQLTEWKGQERKCYGNEIEGEGEEEEGGADLGAETLWGQIVK